jgi:hypothetical protein
MWRTLTREKVDVDKMVRESGLGINRFQTLAALRFDEAKESNGDTEMMGIWDDLASELESLPTLEGAVERYNEVLRDEVDMGMDMAKLGLGLRALCIRKVASFFLKATT